MRWEKLQERRAEEQGISLNIKIVLRIAGWLLYTVLLVRMIMLRNALVIALLVGVLMIRFIMLSRDGSHRLHDIRRSYHTALREDEPFAIPKWRIFAGTLATMSPYITVWVLFGLFIPVGGVQGWALLAIPALFLTGLICKLLADAWKELEMGRWRYWGLFAACYLVSLLPGIILAVIL